MIAVVEKVVFVNSVPEKKGEMWELVVVSAGLLLVAIFGDDLHALGIAFLRVTPVDHIYYLLMGSAGHS